VNRPKQNRTIRSLAWLRALDGDDDISPQLVPVAVVRDVPADFASVTARHGARSTKRAVDGPEAVAVAYRVQDCRVVEA
jgi:hypothetical protein